MPIVYRQIFIAFQSAYVTLLSIDITEFFGAIGRGEKQIGEIIETRTAFFGRYYTSDTYDNGRRKLKAVKLADKATSTTRPQA